MKSAVQKVWGYRHIILGVMWLLYIINFFDRLAVLTLLPFIRQDLNLSHQEVGFAASIFFFAYALAQISSGYLADKFGAKKVMGIAIGVFTFVTFLTGMVRSYMQFVMIRLGLGLGEGHHFSPANKMIADWFPKEEKGRATAFFGTSYSVAPAIIPMTVTFIASLFGGDWRVVFYFLIIPGLIGIILLWYYIENKPENVLARGRMTQEEYDYIKAGIISNEAAVKQAGIAVILKDPYLWLYSLQLFCTMVVTWGSLTWISSFLYEQHGFNLKAMGVLASIPYIIAIFSTMAGGYLMDKVFGKAKPVTIISYLTSIPALIFISQVPKGDTQMLVVALLLVGLCVNLLLGILYAYPQIRYPKEVVGSAMGFSNAVGMMGAFTSPLLAGYLIEKTPTGASYDKVFIMFAASAAIAAVISFFLKEETFIIKKD
ncbi:MAG: MFS transporter [Desulfovibrio sp.]|jgi:sugar phosphate permease|nr:MFS transporter [Desulfovibrio sp.]